MLFLTGCVSAARLPPVPVVGFLVWYLTNPLSGGGRALPARSLPLCPYWSNTSPTLNRPLVVGDRLDALHMATDIVLSEFRP